MSQKQPNILFIMSDDHASNAISLYNSRLSKVLPTPHIDRIGEEGAILQNVFCNNAICTPVRASILTGKHSHQNGVKTLNDTLDPAICTFPKLLQAHGYQTSIIGKWHLN